MRVASRSGRAPPGTVGTSRSTSTRRSSTLEAPIRRALLLTVLLAVAGLGVTACGGDSGDAATTVTKTVVSTAPEGPATTSAPGNSGIVPPNLRADALCRNGGDSSDQACVIRGEKVTGELDFTRYRVVKLIDVQISGDVEISGAKEAVVTGSTFAKDLDIESTGGIVVKTSTINGELELTGAQHATVVKNTIGGDLTCDVRRANGTGNRVTGNRTGVCSTLRR
ncbi:hypothetical protein [Gordonia phthalatica]|uniref:Uncharacterized protein n=1 Tax=Gordonia phthalatica TaxID=1136941 RepID=A0A0N9N3V4_9ACTN|nr:hypothetical protein [Gordonia phthalatica]ALG85475.1 hypothetical protein ACH46_14590 [Gordonia phthalatica]